MFKFMTTVIVSCLGWQAQALTVSSFNLQFYGLGGNMRGTPGNEYRDAHIKKFLEKNLASSDVILFQEIVLVNDLKEKLLPAAYECETYGKRRGENHQHLVACVKKPLKFRIETIEEMDLTGYGRPGLAVTVRGNTGGEILRLIDVHLKAGNDESNGRARDAQLAALTAWLGRQDQSVQTVVAGDFNERESRGLDTALGPAGLAEVVLSQPTYISEPTRNTYNYDRFFVSRPLMEKIRSRSAFQACTKRELGGKGGDDFVDWLFYTRFVSDHCPITLDLDI
jgi:endonuclease/exonuclease/phosphatase family metal-dependent hydrolase